MNKKQRYQGFRKFSIKTRLVIALLLISIIPLAGISGYSFHIFSVALREKLSASISQTLSMINLNMVSEIEKYHAKAIRLTLLDKKLDEANELVLGLTEKYPLYE